MVFLFYGKLSVEKLFVHNSSLCNLKKRVPKLDFRGGVKTYGKIMINMCRTLILWYAKNAQRFSGHFEHHSIIIESVLTDLGLGKVHFSTKIVEISTMLTPSQNSGFSLLVK